jgi:hypothetical protein
MLSRSPVGSDDEPNEKFSLNMFAVMSSLSRCRCEEVLADTGNGRSLFEESEVARYYGTMARARGRCTVGRWFLRSAK